MFLAVRKLVVFMDLDFFTASQGAVVDHREFTEYSRKAAGVAAVQHL